MRRAAEWFFIVGAVLLMHGACSVVLRRRAAAGKRWATSEDPALHATPAGWARREAAAALVLVALAGVLAYMSQ